VAAILAGASTLAAQAGNPDSGIGLPVREVSLENGMRLLVLPRPGAPTVSFVVRYEVGGVNERRGTTGTAHLLEHLLFKGTSTVGTRDVARERALFQRMDAVHDTLLRVRAEPRPDSAEMERLARRIEALEDEARVPVVANEFDRILSRNGARGLNASTSSEATTYYVELPANRLELWFALEADRMSDPVFREFYAERDVVLEERRMRVDTDPGGFLYEQHLAHAWTVHPYRQPVVGTRSDLETLEREDVASYFERYYGPNNAVVAIVGDVDPDRVESLARRYLAPLPRGEEPPPVLAREPPQRGERRVRVEFDAGAQLRMGWHTVDGFHPDHTALVVLTSLLTGGRTSRLYRRLIVEDRLAAQVTSSLGPGDRFPQLFQIHAIPRSPHGPAEVEAAIAEELERLRRLPPDSVELQRVRNQIEAGDVRRLRSNLGLAFQLATSASVHGDWRETFRFGERVRRVTPEDIREVVRRYFRPSGLTVAVLAPAPEVEPATPDSTGDSPTGPGSW
jgi:predicted Zn-dependent peptidase